MSRKPRRDSSRRGHAPLTKLEGDSVLSSGDWPGLEEKRLQAETDICSERWQEEKKSEATEDEFSLLSLPRIGFCDGRAPRSSRPHIIDLSKEDKQRIAALVKELARYREEDKEKSCKLKIISDENELLKARLSKTEKELTCFQLTMKYSEENFKVLSKSFCDKEASLREQNSELRDKLIITNNEKSEVQSKLKESHDQIEKLSKAIYNVSMENKFLNKKYEHTKEKLKNVLETMSKLEVEYSQVYNKSTESKRTQTEISSKVYCYEGKSRERGKEKTRFHRGKLWKCENWERESSDENSLISELFFIPKQKNMSKSQYTSDEELF